MIMRVGFEIKESKLKSSVNRLNLFKVLIVSSTSFLHECTVCSLDSSSSLSPSVITSVGCSGNSETTYSIENGRDWLFPSRKCVLLGTLNWMVASLLGLFLSNSYSASYFLFKVTSLCFLFVVILSTIYKQFSFMH